MANVNNLREMHVNILGKFCNLGVVTSLNWSKVFLVIEDRKFRVYLSEWDYQNRPDEIMFEAPLDGEFCASPWKRKEYEEVSGHRQDEFCFYLEHVGSVANTKMFKIGTDNIQTAESIMRCIELNTRNRTKSF